MYENIIYNRCKTTVCKEAIVQNEINKYDDIEEL